MSRGSLLFVRPADDTAAICAADWGRAVRQLATGYASHDLCGSQATRSSVVAALGSSSALFYFGHGAANALTSNGEPLIDELDLKKLSGPVVAVACYAAQGLGQLATASNSSVTAFLGFDDEVGIPLKVPYPMGWAIVSGLRCLLTQSHDIGCAGQELRGALDNARIDYKENGAKYGMSPSDARTAWLFAKSNRFSVQVYGDYSVKL